MSLNNVCGALIEAGFLTNSVGSGSVALSNVPTTANQLLVSESSSKATWQPALTANSVVGTGAAGVLVANGALSTTQTALGAGVSVGAGVSSVVLGAGATGGADGCVVVGHGSKAPTAVGGANSIVLGNGVDASLATVPALYTTLPVSAAAAVASTHSVPLVIGGTTYRVLLANP